MSKAHVVDATLEGRRVIRFSNHAWDLLVDVQSELNPCLLQHVSSGYAVADEDYAYDVRLAKTTADSGFTGDSQRAQSVIFVSHEVSEAESSKTLQFYGRLDFGPEGPTDLYLEHSFTLWEDTDAFVEQINISHRFGRDTHTITSINCGFRKVLFDEQMGNWRDRADQYALSAIPLRRYRGQVQDWHLSEYQATDLIPANWEGNNLPDRSAEAWSWTDGAEGFVFAKYNQNQIEFSALSTEFYSGGRARGTSHTVQAEVGSVCMRFGGASLILGAPGDLTIDAERPYILFGETSIVPFVGDWQAGHATYKKLLKARGHSTHSRYEPKLHWNELYELSWRGGTNAPLQELPQLLEQATYAKGIGAEALYLDPVWDLYEGSSVWDSERLGPLSSFVDLMADDYGLEVALHIMVHTMSFGDDEAIFRRNREGGIVHWRTRYTGGFVCPASPVWQDIKTSRLVALAEAGVKFFMFDFLDYRIPETHPNDLHDESSEACWSPEHGHSVPMTLEEHAEGVVEVIRRVKRAHPEVIIEAHDRIAGGLQDYLPLYFQHAQDTFDEHWGFEYMWNSFMDLVSGKARSLYEYNLAYDIPLYLHINLGFDNEECLAFWWYASTCRHLGIGGIRPTSNLWAGHLAAIEQYKSISDILIKGDFVGLDERLHLHVNAVSGDFALLAFNLGSEAVDLERSFPADVLGWTSQADVCSENFSLKDDVITVRVHVPPMSPVVLSPRLSAKSPIARAV